MSDKGVLYVDGWLGRREIPCLILEETTRRFLIRLEQDCVLPGRGQRGTKGQEIYVPKDAIRREDVDGYYETPALSARKTTATWNLLNSWIGALRASHYRTLGILKRVAIGASLFAVAIGTSLFAVVWLLWFALRQTIEGVSLAESTLRLMYAGPSVSPKSSPQAGGDALVSKPTYAFTRFGSITPADQSASATPSPRSDVDQKAAVEAERLAAQDSASVKSVQEDPTRIINRGEGHRGKTRPKGHNGRSGASVGSRFAKIKSRVEPGGAETPPDPHADGSSKASGDEQLIKKFVLDYLQTVSSDDVSTQVSFFAHSVTYYGQGVISLKRVQEAKESYDREWPTRDWKPQGEPEIRAFANPRMYEVLQPFTWTLSNGPRHAQGSATLYVKLRKNDKGEFHIVRLEQRYPDSQSQNN